jgi:ribosomal protein S18 acetylase RimI-like enzyme
MAKKATGEKYVVRELQLDSRREAELVADMWNRSEEGWPGGWTGGVPWTAERVMRDFMARRGYGQWVAEHGGQVVGYVNLLAHPSQPQRAYVGLLNARPDHHGRGVGRRLLRRAIDAAIEGGFERVDLGTWPGNLKAVPLYKKTGFFWAPETSVHMDNYIPTILRMPLLAGFFEGKDWYAIQERDLAVCEDVEYWNGVRVYRYRFAAEGRRVELVFDRLACMPASVVTDDVEVSVWVGAEDLPALVEHALHYEFHSRAGRPVRIGLLAQGEPGVPVSVEESFELRGARRLRVPFRLPGDLPRKKPGEPPHRVLSNISLDGVPLRLGTAVQVQDPVQIEYEGGAVPVGVPTPVHVNLRNRLPFPVTGALWAASGPAVQRGDEALAFRIRRGGRARVSLSVKAAEPGPHRLDLQVRFSDQTAVRLSKGTSPAREPVGRSSTVWLRALAPGAFVATEDQDQRNVTIESDRLVVVFHRYGGWTTITERERWRQLFGLGMPEAGPPFGEFRPVPTHYGYELRDIPGGTELTTRRDHEHYPGLALERRLAVTGSAIRLSCRLVNAADAPYVVELRTGADGRFPTGRFTLPWAGGLVQHERRSWNDWPMGDELAGPATRFAESWCAVDHDGLVCGLVWQGDPAEVAPTGGGGARLAYRPVTVAARGSADLPDLYLVGGSGDWRRVRNIWQTHVLTGELVSPRDKEPPARDVLRCSLADQPTVLVRATQRVPVRLETDQVRPLSGDARLRLPRAVTLAGGGRELQVPVRNLALNSPVTRSVSVRARAGQPTAGTGSLELAVQRVASRFDVPVIVLRAPGARLRLASSEDTVDVDTGCIRFTASAAHAGSVVSLDAGKGDLLRSSYPEPSPYLFANPWYGGVRAVVGNDWDRRSQQATRTLRTVALSGASGTTWQGAEVTATLTHRDWRWCRYRARYLGSAGCNLMAVLVRVENRTSAAMALGYGVEVWPADACRMAYVDVDGRPRACASDRYEFGFGELEWAAFDCGRRGFLAVVPRREPGWKLSIDGHDEGCFSTQSRQGWVQLRPDFARTESLTWIVACRTLEEAHAYRALAALEGLP